MISTAALARSIFSILAGLFFLSTVFFFANNTALTKENRALQAELKTFKDKIDKTLSQSAPVVDSSLRAELEKMKSDLESAVEERSYLEEILITKTRQIETLEKELAGRAAGAPALPADRQGAFSGVSVAPDIASRIEEKDQEIRRLTERNLILSKKIQKLYKLTSERMSEINVAKITLEETISNARKQIETEWNTVDLGSISAEPGSARQAAVAAGAGRQARAGGRVLAINEEHGFVVVDMGRVDGIDDGTRFSLTKNGQPMGTLKVLEVRDVMTACNIQDLVQGTKIEVNDPVAILR